MEESPVNTAEHVEAPSEVIEVEVKDKETVEIVDEGVKISDGKTSPTESEYDSAGSYSETEEDHETPKSRRDTEKSEVNSEEPAEHEQDLEQDNVSNASHSGHSDHTGGEEDNEADNEEGSVILERQEGDGQESLPQKKVDDDEDKKNPQYIPKRGTFYEHDDRTADDIEEASETAETEKDKDSKKKVWQDKKERWSHDKFNDTDQAPKTKSELISNYGYDIRNEEGPPKARRRRRYGRGPNKYTRNWEDEDAYMAKQAPPAASARPKRNDRPRRTEEEFPALGHNDENSGRDNASYNRRNNVDNNNKSWDKNRERNRNNRRAYPEKDRSDDTSPVSNYPTNNMERGNRSQSPTSSNVRDREQPAPLQQRAAPPQQQSRDTTGYVSNGNIRDQQQLDKGQRVGSGRVVKPKKEVKDSDYKGFTNFRNRNVRIPQQQQQGQDKYGNGSQRKDDYIHSQNFTSTKNTPPQQDVEHAMSQLNVHDGVYKGGNKGLRQGSVPPRLQSDQKGPSKRYSSMRQRSLPEANTPPVMQHPNYYPNEYNQQAPPTQQPGGPQQILHQAPQLHPSGNNVPPPTLVTMPQQVPVTATPLLQGAPQFAPPPFPQAAPTFIQAGVAPPAFIQQPAPQLINYVQPAAQFTQGFQGFQQFNPVSQPTELYQPQGGITYYSADQQIPQRTVPQKRPKAAIPIVAPPSYEDGKLRGRQMAPEEMVSSAEYAADSFSLE